MIRTCKFPWALCVVAPTWMLIGGGCGEDERESGKHSTTPREDAAALVEGDGGVSDASSEDEDGGAPDAESAQGESLYVMNSLFFGTEDMTSYVKLLDTVEPQTIDYEQAREFPGLSDVWVHEGAVFVTNPESLIITKFTVKDRALVEGARLSFAAYGLTDFGFWLNTFVSPTKAYFLNGAQEYIVWNPESMEITGTLPMPELEVRDGLKPFPGYADRAAILRGTKLYQPLYWADESFFLFTPDSRIVVIDTERDEVADVLEAPCPGLDYATKDEQGDLYFSSWVFAPGGAAVLDQPATCVVKVPPGDDSAAVAAFDVAEVTDGREGGAMRYLGNGRAILSVLHHEHAASDDVQEVSYGANWRFWSYDLESGMASALESVPWNAGAAYPAEVDGRRFTLVPAGDYSSTTLYELSDDADPEPVFEASGWVVRLFKIPAESSK